MAFEDSTPLPDVDYTEMILSAIEELVPEEGVDEKAISSYIESNYPDLPTAHSTLLSSTLEKMCETGQLILADNNYSKPDTNIPSKRGRGRPPKDKTGNTPAKTVPIKTGPPRSRGRPPMARDPLAPPPQPKKSSGRPRGRPPTKSSTATVPTVTLTPVSGVKRGRGRPPKNA